MLFGERKPGRWFVHGLAGWGTEVCDIGREVLGPVGADGGGIGVEDGKTDIVIGGVIVDLMI